MDRIDVHLGQQVASGEPVGRLGLVGTEEAHLHYEQLYDTIADTTAQGHRLRPVQEVGREVRVGAAYNHWWLLTDSTR